jgi:hypothetical protein
MFGNHKDCSGTVSTGETCLCECDEIETAEVEASIVVADNAEVEAIFAEPKTFTAAGEEVATALNAAQLAGVDGVLAGQPPLEASFNQAICPVCHNEQEKKNAAVEASQKAEMILVIRDIVGRFKRQTDSQLTALSNKVTSHLNTIVAASNDLTVTKHDLDLSLLRLEEDLKDAFGIKDMLDPNWAGNAMFLEDEEGEPLDLFEAPAPGTDPVFDKLSADVDAALTSNDPDDIEPGAQTDRRPFKAGDQTWN